MDASWIADRIGNELRIFYGDDECPQYGVLHLNDSYFRLNSGPTSGWGTSVILLPIFWSRSQCPPPGLCHGAPVEVISRVEGSDLILAVTGAIGGLHVSSTVRFSPPAEHSITVEITTTVEGMVVLEPRPGEAFKPVMLSSMHISSTLWDTQVAYAGSHTFPLPMSGWIVQPPVVAQVFGLRGGTSAWKTNAPTIEVMLDRPMHIAGWVTQSNDPNDDNIGLWAASDNIVPRWNFKIISALPTALSTPSVCDTNDNV